MSDEIAYLPHDVRNPYAKMRAFPLKSSAILTHELIRFACRHFQLDPAGIHGVSHWVRVRINGLLLARLTGANVRVIELFAFLHDVERRSDGSDPDHGSRAASLIETLQGHYFQLTDDEYWQLREACQGHSRSGKHWDETVCCCWDADRLDFGRLNKRTDAERLMTDAARDPKLLEGAWARSARAREIHKRARRHGR